MKRLGAALLALLGALALGSVVQAQTPPTPPAPKLIQFSIAPSFVFQSTSTSKQFVPTATWDNGAGTLPAISWFLVGPGTLSTTGLLGAGTAKIGDSSWVTATAGGLRYQSLVVWSSLAKIFITPAAVTIVPGAKQQFKIVGVRSTGDIDPTTTVAWSCTGGTITASGLFTAGTVEGKYTIKALRTPNSTWTVTTPITVQIPPPGAPTAPVALDSSRIR